MRRTEQLVQIMSATPDLAPLLEEADALRQEISPTLDADNRAELGQFMTPAVVSRFMASLFSRRARGPVTLLDAGAGVGGLSGAFIEHHAMLGATAPVHVVAYEIDSRLRKALSQTLASYRALLPSLNVEVHGGDFIEKAVNDLQFQAGRRFSHAILNPPYKKINTDSGHRRLLRLAGIETVNLYTAFVALAIQLMEPGGEVVAIIPRSFCNGPYYRPFRAFLLEKTAIEHIHLFESRTSAFSDDAVLQENIIIRFVVGGAQGEVCVSTSSDKTLSDRAERTYPFGNIVAKGDPEIFIHVPKHNGTSSSTPLDCATSTLKETGLEVSTGPVVDFRLKEFLLKNSAKNSAPLLYASHFVNGNLAWPRADGKKPNAIALLPETEKWLYPNNGFYTVVRRFSSKEERRRIVAYVVDPKCFPRMSKIGFENHLNVFHRGKHGLDEVTARGLAVYLNSTALDDYFRRFSGHTQVNATDLRNMPYPPPSALARLGRWAKKQSGLSQELIDKHLNS